MDDLRRRSCRLKNAAIAAIAVGLALPLAACAGSGGGVPATMARPEGVLGTMCWNYWPAGDLEPDFYLPNAFVIPPDDRRDPDALGVRVPGADAEWWVSEVELYELLPGAQLDEISVVRWWITCHNADQWRAELEMWAELEVASDPSILIEAAGRLGWIDREPIVVNPVSFDQYLPVPWDQSPGAELRIVDLE